MAPKVKSIGLQYDIDALTAREVGELIANAVAELNAELALKAEHDKRQAKAAYTVLDSALEARIKFWEDVQDTLWGWYRDKTNAGEPAGEARQA